jgi:hypothetical protein
MIWPSSLDRSGCPTYHKFFETSILSLVSTNFQYVLFLFTREAKRPKHELTPYKKIIQWNMNRPYMKDVTHIHGWQFFLLADHLKDLIKCPRLHPNGTHPANNIPSKCKLDHFHHLYYCLKWLNDSNFNRTREADIGYGK